MKKIVLFCGSILFCSIFIISGVHSSLGTSLISLLLLTGFLLTALPFCYAIFGRTAEAWIFVFPVGFILHCIVLSFFGFAFGINRSIILSYIIITALLSILFRKTGKVRDQDWTKVDVVLLFVWILSSILVTAPAFLNVGKSTDAGFAYRAYFNADFFRNLAVSGSLSNSGVPPNNPYVTGFRLNYYWFFHLLLSFWKTIFPTYRPDYMLVQFTLVSVCIFVASFYVVLRRFVSSRKTLVLLLPLLLLGGSYKGLYVLMRVHHAHWPWQAFVAWNIEGVFRWLWNAPQVDVLYRAFLYAPQHLIALSIFFPMLLVWSGQISRKGRCALYPVLFASVGVSFFVGGLLSIFAAIVLIVQTIRNFKKWWPDLLFASAIGIILLAIIVLMFRMVEFAPNSTPMKIGLDPAIREHFFKYTFLSWGAIFVVGIAGIVWKSEKIPRALLLSFLGACLLVIYCVELDLPGSSDISLKVGYLSFIILIFFAAGFIDRVFVRHSKYQVALVASIVLLLLPAVVTWGMDAYNCQDIHNTKFTTFVGKEDSEMFQWIRKNLPAEAVVQSYSRGKGYLQEFVTEVPPFAERPMYLGDKNMVRLFQIPKKVIDQRRKMITKSFKENSPERLSEDFEVMGIDYIFISEKMKDSNDIRQHLAEPYFHVIKQDHGAFLIIRERHSKITSISSPQH